MADDFKTTDVEVRHRFLDEMGDSTFYGKGRKLILGQEGVSLSFGLGIVRIDRPLEKVREEVMALQRQVESDPLLNTIPSVQKRPLRVASFFTPARIHQKYGQCFFDIFESCRVRRKWCSQEKFPRCLKGNIIRVKRSFMVICWRIW
jgi:hypothetical protein